MTIMPTNAVFDLPISKIKIGKRHRKDMGDIDVLAASIELCGLLQAIGVTGERELIFGERRLLALKQLGRKVIPARVIDIASIAQGEFHENEIRKDFTVSERVAIEETLRVDLRSGKILPPDGDKDRIKDEAARLAGFGNRETARQAKKVVDHGAPELVDAMDAGQVSISVAAKLADLPKKEQRERLILPTKAEARNKANKTGKMILARDGYYHGPNSPEIEERNKVWFTFKRAIWALSEIGATPEQVISAVPAYQREDVTARVATGTKWLSAFSKAWSSQEK